MRVIRANPWPRALLTLEDEAAIRAALPAGHWVNLSGRSAKGPFLAALVGPSGEVRRAESGLPVVAALRALGVEA